MYVFQAIAGDRTGVSLEYICPDCGGVDSGDHERPGTGCERCQARGTITLKHMATIAMWEAQKAANDSEETP